MLSVNCRDKSHFSWRVVFHSRRGSGPSNSPLRVFFPRGRVKSRIFRRFEYTFSRTVLVFIDERLVKYDLFSIVCIKILYTQFFLSIFFYFFFFYCNPWTTLNYYARLWGITGNCTKKMKDRTINLSVIRATSCTIEVPFIFHRAIDVFFLFAKTSSCTYKRSFLYSHFNWSASATQIVRPRGSYKKLLW